jgi:hypothetical protein
MNGEMFGEPELKRSPGKNNIRMNLREMKWEVVDCIHLAQDSDQWQSLVNTVTNLQVPEKVGNFLTTWATLSFSRTASLS